MVEEFEVGKYYKLKSPCPDLMDLRVDLGNTNSKTITLNIDEIEGEWAEQMLQGFYLYPIQKCISIKKVYRKARRFEVIFKEVKEGMYEGAWMYNPDQFNEVLDSLKGINFNWNIFDNIKF